MMRCPHRRDVRRVLSTNRSRSRETFPILTNYFSLPCPIWITSAADDTLPDTGRFWFRVRVRRQGVTRSHTTGVGAAEAQTESTRVSLEVGGGQGGARVSFAVGGGQGVGCGDS